jgi:RNA polymerase sigma-70 factor (ECF subfamily)
MGSVAMRTDGKHMYSSEPGQSRADEHAAEARSRPPALADSAPPHDDREVGAAAATAIESRAMKPADAASSSTQDAPALPAWGAVDFAAQFRAHSRVLWLIAIGIVRDAGLAEDVVQDAALIGLKKMHTFVPGTNFRAWMGRMVRLVALNRARKERRRGPLRLGEMSGLRSHLVMPGTRPGVTSAGEVAQDQEDFDDRVVAALNTVSPTARACLLLRTVEDLDYAEISAVLGIPEGTAMSHVHRTRIHLRARLSADQPAPPIVRKA